MCIKDIRKKHEEIQSSNIVIAGTLEEERLLMKNGIDYPLELPTGPSLNIRCPRLVIAIENLKTAEQFEKSLTKFVHPYSFFKFICGDDNDNNNKENKKAEGIKESVGDKIAD